MSRRAATFTKADVRRAVLGVGNAGKVASAVEIGHLSAAAAPEQQAAPPDDRLDIAENDMTAEVQIIKRTELANGTAVVTTQQSDSHLIRPFHTFAVTPTSRYAQRLTDATCVSVALHQHEQMVRQLTAHAGPTGGDVA